MPLLKLMIRACRRLAEIREWRLLACLSLLGAAIVLFVVAHSEDVQPVPQASDIDFAKGEPIDALTAARHLDSRKVAFGRLLFEDPRLSSGARLSCLSCHDTRSNGSGPRLQGRFDTPTVFNAALNPLLGWRGAQRSLEQQALDTLRLTMTLPGSSIDQLVAERLRTDRALNASARALYGRDLDVSAVVDAIATYERSLVTPDSRFDQWLEGDAMALGAQAGRGYERFKRLGCASCHQGRNVGGNLLQRHGIFRPLAARRPEILRVPSLRNVAETPPYFHDGSTPTLPLAIKRMAASQLDIDLSPSEIADIEAFLRSLTGTHAGKPVRAPR